MDGLPLGGRPDRDNGLSPARLGTPDCRAMAAGQSTKWRRPVPNPPFFAALTAIFPSALIAFTAAPGTAAAQSGPAVDIEVMTDYRDRGISWSDGEAAARVLVDVPISQTISVSGQAATLRQSNRHGGADAGFDLAARYADYHGLIDWHAGIVGHVFAGGDGDLNYLELEGGVGAALGPAEIDVRASYAPSQDAIGGSNFHVRAGAYLGIPATPLTLYSHVGRSSGSSDGSGLSTRLRPAGSYTDWAIGAEYYLMPLSFTLTYSDTNIGRDDLRLPVMDNHYGEKLVAGAIVRF